MKHLKIFENFVINESNEFRMPERVTKEDFDKKLNNYKWSPFTKEENEFFMKFSEKMNVKEQFRKKSFKSSKKSFDIFNSDGYYLATLEIIKLDDGWYLITDYTLSVKRYICDEWEEVVGYLIGCSYNFKMDLII
jgi:hypothetical protein